MKWHIILALITLALVSCGGAQQQKLSNENLTDNFAALVNTTATENTGENAFPELVFEDFDIEKSVDAGSNVIPQVLQNATRIAFNNDQVKFTDGTNEISIPLDFNESYEEIASDGTYSWTFVVKENDKLPKENYISIETSWPVEHMEKMEPYLGAEYAPLAIIVDNTCDYYPKRFKQWKALKRKMLPSYPSNAEYYENLDWASHDHTPEGLEVYHPMKYFDYDINQDGIDDMIAFNSESLSVYYLDAQDAITSEKTFKAQNDFAKSMIEDVTYNPEDGVMVIRTEWSNDRGASGSDDYTVRYQDGDFYLISYECQYPPCTSETYDLLTYKKITESGYCDGDMERTTSTLKELPLKKLSDIKIGQYHCQDYEGKK